MGTLLHLFVHDEQWRWEALLYLANVDRHSIRDIVRRGPVDFSDADFAWTYWAVQQRVRRGREEWARRLQAAGLWNATAA